MSRKPQHGLLAMACGAVVGLLWPAIGVPQDAAAESPPAASDAEAEDQIPLREQSIYIPYEKLRKVFEKEGRGVFLPYEKFRELWDAAREKTAPPTRPKPPVGALITEVQSEATVSEDVVRVEALVKIEVLAEGWNEVPLRLSDAAITGASLGDQPARIVTAEGGGYKLLVEKVGQKPQQVELTLQYAKAITRAPGQNSVSFEAPQAPVSRWRVRIPETGVKVNLHPLIAATEVSTAEGGEPEAEDAAGPDETVVLAFVGVAPTVRIEWTPKAEGATGLEALASVQAEQQVVVDEGVTRTRTQLAYKISRAGLGQLAIEVPADQKVAGVFDTNVRQWSVERGDDSQTITVQLFEPAKATQNVTVELEKFIGEEEQETTFIVPVVKAVGVGRQQGVVAVQVAEGLRAHPTRTTGLLQVDAADLPGSLTGGRWAFSYRYAAVPFDLQLSIENVQPRILVDSLVEAELAPERLSIDMLAIYTVERAGVFRLELNVPADFEVRQVRGREAAGAAAAQVDTHHLEDLEAGGKKRLVVNLGRKALGRVALAVELRRELQEPDLLAPTGNAAEISLPIPRIVPESVERAAGRVVVYAPESLRVNPAETEGLRSISFQEALEGMESARGGKRSDARPVLAFAYTQEPTQLSLSAERRKPQVTIRQLLMARIEDGVVKYQATFFYEILYSGVKSLRIDVPTEVAAGLRNNTPHIRQRVITPPPDDLAEGYVAWSLSGETELIGEGKIELVWEEKLEKLDVGGSDDVALPLLKPMEVDRAWGQIVLTKVETIDIQESGETSGLRPIDPQHDLMAGADVPGGAAAFEFHDDWALTVTATRYELEEVKHTSIERAVLRMVVTRAEKITVQALYRMRSARQRLVVKMPGAAEFDTEPRINGRPVTLELGPKEGEYFVPLVETEDDESFLLELRYTVSGDGSRLDPPEFPLEPAVQKVYLCAYLPEEWALLDVNGPWTEEFRWELVADLSWEPVFWQGESRLLQWVSEPVALNESFPTDGRLYVFSALRPRSAPEGSLHLRTTDDDLLNGLVLAVVLLGGLLLLPARTSVRALAIGVLLIALVLCGVFNPILARQVLDGVLASAVLVVLIVWVVYYFAWTRPRQEKPVDAEPVDEPAPEQPPQKDASEDDRSRRKEPDTDSDQGGKTDA